MTGNNATPIELIDQGPWRMAGGDFIGPGSDAWFSFKHDSPAVPWHVKVRVAAQGGRLVCTGLRIGLDDNEVEAMGTGYRAPEVTTGGLREVHLSKILDVVKAQLSLDVYQVHLWTFADRDARPDIVGPVVPEGTGPTVAGLLQAKIADGALTVRRGRQPLRAQEVLAPLALYEELLAEGLKPTQAIDRVGQHLGPPRHPLSRSQVYRRIAAARRLRATASMGQQGGAEE